MQLQISSFIATLGTGIVLSGVTLGISNGQVLVLRDSEAPHRRSDRVDCLGLGVSVWLTLVLALDHVLRARAHAIRTTLYAIGGSERVAFLAGVPTGR